MTSKYKNNKSVAKNPTVSIDVDDPRVSWENLKQTQSRIGSEIEIIGAEGKAIFFGGDFAGAAATDKNVIPPYFPANITLPSGNEPPKTYPGGSGPFIIVPTDPANVVAVWSGDDLVVTFDWDANNEYNVTISQFILEVTADGVTRRTPMNTFVPNKSSTSQTATLTKTLNKLTFGLFRTKITAVCVLVADPLNNISQTICASSVGAYVLNLPIPVITLTGTTSGYSVDYTTPVSGPFDALDVWEIESTETTAPSVIFAADGITPTNYVRVYFDDLNPAQVTTGSTNKRWAMARFSSEGGIYTLFCDPKVVTPLSPVVADNEGPPDVAAGSVTVSGGIDTSGFLGFNAYADIQWGAVTTGDIRGYRIRFSNDGGTTFSYADSPGTALKYRLGGLAVGSTYKIAVATYDQYNNTSTNYVVGPDVTVSGIPSVSNYITAGPFQFGVGVGGVNTNKGLYFNDNNKWYINSESTAILKVGGGTSNYLYWDGSDFLIDGNISARKGTFSGNVTIAGGGSLQSFITPPTVFSISAVTYTASTAVYTTTANHGYVVGDDVLISGLLPQGYNGKFRVTAQTPTTFTVTNTTNAALTDSVGSVILITGTGFVLNKDGLAFNSSTTRDITTINAETGLFTTQSANIGGWQVDSSKIQKTSIVGKGNIILDSSNGYIAVSNSAISSSLAGVNSPGNDLNHSVFWAGTNDPNSTANPFRVTLGGKLHATSAAITGTVSSIGPLGRMTLDGDHGYISLQSADTPGGAVGPAAYIIPRNSNLYITSPSAQTPWSASDLTKGINTSGPINGPYFAAGSRFKDYWNNTVQGVGTYTGVWDYFGGGTSDPFITTTKTGIQLSVSPSLGLLLDKGDSTLTGDKLTPGVPANTPSMLFYTSNEPSTATKPYSPTTKYGAWAAFTSNKIKLTAALNTFINISAADGTSYANSVVIKATEKVGAVFNSSGILLEVDGDTYQELNDNYIKLQAVGTVNQTFNPSGILIQSTANVWQRFNSSGIRLQATEAVYQEIDSSSITLRSGLDLAADGPIGAYGGYSQIVINASGVNISGIPRAATFDMQDYRSGRFVNLNGSFVPTNNWYKKLEPLGYVPRQRAVIEDPVTGRAELGFGIYYMDITKINIDETDLPSNTMGIVGDLAVMF